MGFYLLKLLMSDISLNPSQEKVMTQVMLKLQDRDVSYGEGHGFYDL